MKKLLLLLLVTAIAVPSISMSGTSRSPEITDPAGDAVFTPAIQSQATLSSQAPQPVPWADLTGVWFATTRNRRKAVTGFSVTFRTVAAPVGVTQDVSMTADWAVGDSCFGSITVWRGATGSMGDADLYYGCNGSDPASVANDNFNVPLTATFKGNTISASIPLSSLKQGLSKGVYKRGTKLSGTYATSSIYVGVETDAIRVDQAPDQTVIGTLAPGLEEYGRDFMIGS